MHTPHNPAFCILLIITTAVCSEFAAALREQGSATVHIMLFSSVRGHSLSASWVVLLEKHFVVSLVAFCFFCLFEPKYTHWFPSVSVYITHSSAFITNFPHSRYVTHVGLI